MQSRHLGKNRYEQRNMHQRASLLNEYSLCLSLSECVCVCVCSASTHASIYT